MKNSSEWILPRHRIRFLLMGRIKFLSMGKSRIER